MSAQPEIHYSACPHDCPSTCALEVERLGESLIGKVRGAKHNSYTAGIVCSKVARYAERIHHPDRLTHPLRRTGARGSGEFRPIGWDDALDEVAEAMLGAEQRLGSETVWPYYYAGTMGLVMRDGINRLRHAKRYSGQYSTICTTLAWNGFIAGTGRLAGSDPREMAKSDLVVIWGTNAASTQVNVMHHVLAARRERGAHIVVVDTYRNATAKQADSFVCVRPGTDGALACGIMHVLFRDGYANREYLERYTDCPAELEAHLASRTPQWASAISGVPVEQIETLARRIGETPRTYLRLGYGFSRQRNGCVNMHAALSIAAVTGAWMHEGGGAFHNNGAIYNWDKTLIEGLDVRDPDIRVLDQSRIGQVLVGEPEALRDGPPVTALLIQNTNPMMIAAELRKVHRGFAREDLFVCVHEQFMTATARMADIVLPATMFLEHDDVYQSGGHQHITLGPKIVEAPGECRSNHDLICALARRLGAEHPGFEMSAREIIDHTLTAAGWDGIERLEAEHWFDCQPDFDTAHYVNGFAHAAGASFPTIDSRPCPRCRITGR
jgi:anaerobic selenocysteine-containing dehydrogenase